MIGSFIEQYELGVLEWFNRAYPALTHMIYAKDKAQLLAEGKTLEYPSLLYYRDDAEHVLPKALECYDEGATPSRATKTVLFSLVQPYTAHLYLNDEADLYRVANIIRQKWYKDSYVTLTYPDVDTKVRVGMFLKGFRFQTERTSVDEKGPERTLEIAWQSTLVMEAAYTVPRYTGFRLSLVTPGEERMRILSTCKGDSCSIG